MDYENFGFKAGIEIHAQLNTERKLFCSCPAILKTGKPDFMFQRRLRPVLGEMGVYDRALLLEWEKKLDITYEGYNDCCCTYEMDETPPFLINDEAVDKAVILSLMMNCHMFNELAVMRKNYLDGSVVAGFQRTAFLAAGGHIPINNASGQVKKIGISYVYIEEDAARKDNELSKDNRVFFRLDRLGFPLIEIVTDPDMTNIEEVVNTASALGMLLKGSGTTRRGLGTIRQDLNVSITGGNRVELKGIQKLDLFQPAIDNEINRQLALIEIKEMLQQLGISREMLETGMVDLNEHLKGTKSKIFGKALKNGSTVIGYRLPGFNGLLGKEIQPDHHLGTEMAHRVKSFTLLAGIIHTDENLQEYGLSEREITAVKEKLELGDQDAGIILIGDAEGYQTKRAVDFSRERAIMSLDGVPEETRQVQADGRSFFMRDLHGRSRLYPDTDHPLFTISKERVDKLRNVLPERPDKVIQKLETNYTLKHGDAVELLMDGNHGIFIELAGTGIDNKVLVTTFTQILTALRRQNIPVDDLDENAFRELFNAFREGKFSKEAIPDVLSAMTRGEPLPAIIEKLGGTMTIEELQNLIKKVIESRMEFIQTKREAGEDIKHIVSPLMGPVMKEARGKADGKLIHKELARMLEEVLNR
ncbi:MAG: Glu-tRNA(Gln) amidotransferase subunit GatE [Candidatus Odinarchaeota archaeon]